MHRRVRGVFLEGFEVAFTVITFGTARRHSVALAAAAAVALLAVVVAGVLVHAPLFASLWRATGRRA